MDRQINCEKTLNSRNHTTDYSNIVKLVVEWKKAEAICKAIYIINKSF